MNLEERFQLIHKCFIFFVLQEGNTNEIEYINNHLSTQEKLKFILQEIEECCNIVTSQALFSKNEEVDDIPTSSLKFLLLEYYKGQFSYLCGDPIHEVEIRIDFLLQAKNALEKYLFIIEWYNIINEQDLEILQGSHKDSIEKQRNRKITLFKEQKATKERIKTLELIRNNVDREEEWRELLILQLQSFARQACNDLPIIQQEIELLRYRLTLEGQTNNSSSDNTIPIPQENIYPMDRPGLSVTRLTKVGDEIISRKETIKANVFQPRMEKPSMSLEEYGDQMKQEAEERAKREAEVESTVPRRYEHLVKDGDEDNIDLVDQATLADRDWDAFKEANPRGWGNKAGRRF